MAKGSNKNKYEIVIKIREGAGNGALASPAPSAQEREPNYAGKLSTMLASKTIDAGLKRVVSFVASNVQLVTGSSEMQQRVNVAMQIASYGSQTLSNIATAQTYAVGLGLGVGTGVAIGVALSLAQIGIDYAEKAAQLRINQIIENQRLEQIRSRAGYSFNRSRMGAE